MIEERTAQDLRSLRDMGEILRSDTAASGEVWDESFAFTGKGGSQEQ